jgi:paraquat-inducible protein B
MADNQKRSATLIGTFVIGGIVLFLAGLVAFSTSSLFARKQEFVMYFDSSLKGLSAGSPVSFRGVQIGQVTNIVMEIDKERRHIVTPVYVEIDYEKFRMPGIAGQISLLAEPPIKKMIERGLRAQLQSQSLITGQMYIELEFRPSYAAQMHDYNHTGLDEIPTIPSQLAQVQATLQSALESFRKLELQELADTSVATLKTAHAAAYEFYEVMHKINKRIDPILANIDTATGEGTKAIIDLQQAMKDVRAASDNASKMFRSVDKEVAAVSPSVNKGADNARVAFEEVAAAMRALKELAEYLERNPDALLTGKQQNRR